MKINFQTCRRCKTTTLLQKQVPRVVMGKLYSQYLEAKNYLIYSVYVFAKPLL